MARVMEEIRRKEEDRQHLFNVLCGRGRTAASRFATMTSGGIPISLACSFIRRINHKESQEP
jgi:hypothetical protein